MGMGSHFNPRNRKKWNSDSVSHVTSKTVPQLFFTRILFWSPVWWPLILFLTKSSTKLRCIKNTLKIIGSRDSYLGNYYPLINKVSLTNPFSHPLESSLTISQLISFSFLLTVPPINVVTTIQSPQDLQENTFITNQLYHRNYNTFLILILIIPS